MEHTDLALNDAKLIMHHARAMLADMIILASHGSRGNPSSYRIHARASRALRLAATDLMNTPLSNGQSVRQIFDAR